MRLGIDFGTTRTTVAVVDRGNYPLATFEDGFGDIHEFFPSVVAEGPGGLVCGFEALEAARAGLPHRRSFKRLLADPTTTASTEVSVGSLRLSISDLLTQFLTALHTSLITSLVSTPNDTVFNVAVGVPAQASSTQRLITLDAFRKAGFHVVAMVNEPSAAGFEYTHRFSGTLNSKRQSVLIYDLGGGTFDASVVNVAAASHEIVNSNGDNHLGGDDFDVLMAQCTADLAGLELSDELVEQACLAKESIVPQTRWVGVACGSKIINVAVADFYDRAKPLIQRSVQVMQPLLSAGARGPELAPNVAGVYVVGGASELPIVSRMLREAFGRRVHRSPHSAGSTAIGLAIAADPDAGYTLTDRLSRGLGVFREVRGGQSISFDVLLSADLDTTSTHAVTVARRYRAAHNIGHYRFVEFSGAPVDGVPTGDVVPVGDLVMPYLRELQDLPAAPLASMPVERTDIGPLIQETYHVDPHGIIRVTITNIDTGFSLTQVLGSCA